MSLVVFKDTLHGLIPLPDPPTLHDLSNASVPRLPTNPLPHAGVELRLLHALPPHAEAFTRDLFK
eukprot:4224745-Alexandrium_andersonii.AAC.1